MQDDGKLPIMEPREGVTSSVTAVGEGIATIERDLDANSYKPGPWARTVKETRALPIADRRELAAELSRVSRRLHERGARHTVSAEVGYAIEAVFAALGVLVLGMGVHNG